MKTKIRIVLAASVTSFLPFALAIEPAPAPGAAVPPAQTVAPAAAPAPSPVRAELEAVVAKVKAKLQAGATTEAALTNELKEFDTLFAAHQGEKTEDVAQILLMKALLYVQVFHDFDKGELFFKQLQSDFPNTEAGKNVEKIMPMLQKQKEAAKTQENLKTGAVFPDFQETDVAGAPLSIAKFKGKVVLVDFWATWCGPCVAELPNVTAAYQKYHDKGFEIVGISLDKDKGELEKFTKEKGMTWAQYFDGKGWESKLAQKYGITSIPATYLIDGDGKIIASNLRGPALEAELGKRLAAK